MEDDQSLFQKYGGISGVSKIVHALYAKIKRSEAIAVYFQDVDMERLIHHQTQFFSSIMGGPIHYSGQQLEAAHRRLHITHEDFLEVAELLEEALEDCEVSAADIETIMTVVAGAEHQIVSR